MNTKLTKILLMSVSILFLVTQQVVLAGGVRVDIHEEEGVRLSPQMRLAISIYQSDPDGNPGYTENHTFSLNSEREITFDPTLRFYPEHAGPSYLHVVLFTFQLVDFDGKTQSTPCYWDLVWVGDDLRDEQMHVNITVVPKKKRFNFYGFVHRDLPFSLQGR